MHKFLFRPGRVLRRLLAKSAKATVTLMTIVQALWFVSKKTKEATYQDVRALMQRELIGAFLAYLRYRILGLLQQLLLCLLQRHLLCLLQPILLYLLQLILRNLIQQILLNLLQQILLSLLH
jgi:hypothetical protein